jgi:hypothetical protein
MARRFTFAPFAPMCAIHLAASARHGARAATFRASKKPTGEDRWASYSLRPRGNWKTAIDGSLDQAG